MDHIRLQRKVSIGDSSVWEVGSKVLVFCKRLNKWVDATIIKLSVNDHEWIKVEYLVNGKKNSKFVNKTDHSDVKPVT